MAQNSVLTDDELELDNQFELEYEDDDELDSASEGSNRGETETQPSFDWDSEENPYKQRFKGLQGSLQQSQEARTQAEQRALYAEGMAVQAQIAHLDEPQQRLIMQNWMAQKALEVQSRTTQDRENAVSEVARVMMIQQVAQETGADPKKLSRFSNYEDMMTYAQDIKETKKSGEKQTQKAVRKAKGSDSFGRGGGSVSGAPRNKPKDMRDAVNKFKSLKIT